MKKIFLYLPLVLLSLTLNAAAAAPEHGCVLARVGDDRATVLHETDVRSAAAFVREFTVEKSQLVAGGSFALGAQIDNAPPGLTVSLNGEALEVHPLEYREQFWWQIPASMLRAGGNELRIAGEDGTTITIADIALFPLLTGGEEAHFARMLAGDALKAQPPTHPNQDKMDIRHMDLALTLDVNSRVISNAVAEVTFRSLDSTLTQAVLDFDTNSGSFPVSGIQNADGGGALAYTSDGTRLYITLPSALPAGEDFTVRVAYGGTPRIGTFSFLVGGYFRETHNSVPLLYTGSQPYFARTWFPSKDVPEDKFTADLHVTVPAVSYGGYPFSVVSNGKLMGVDEVGGTRTYHWSESFNVASYLISITATNFRAATATYTALDGTTTMDVTHYVYPENYAAEAPEAVNTATAIRYFATMFGEYPFLSEKYATATWAETYGMEHQTCTSMPPNQLATPWSRRNVHELAHMWFGDMVTCGHYDHVWLNEGWATLCEALIYEYQTTLQSGAAAGKQTYHDYVNAWTTSDSYPLVSSSADNFSGSIVYRKGAFVLHMLRGVVGDADFFQAARNYLNDPELQYGTALTEDLQRHYEAVSGLDLDRFFQQWVYRAPRPNYQWAYSTRTVGADTILDLYINQTQAGEAFWMPVQFGVSFAGGSNEIVKVLNDQTTQGFSVNLGPRTVSAVSFDPDNWILDTNTQITAPTAAPPTIQTVISDGATTGARITWVPSGTPGVTGYELYRVSPDGGSTLIAGPDVLTAGVAEYSVPLAVGEEAYFSIVAIGPGASNGSDFYGARRNSGPARILIVDGYDRGTIATGNNHDYAMVHGASVAASGYAFDSCANEAVGSLVDLNDYSVVIWFCSEESTGDETFSTAEQDLVKAYLEAGGRLFVSGNEIGWDLDWRGSPTDKDFYHDYLRASFDDDDSEVYSLIGPQDTIFDGAAFTYGGAGAPYVPQYPDAILPSGAGTIALLTYPGSAFTAAVGYSGTFGAANEPGKVITAGFAFETIDTRESRDDFMRRILQDFLASNPREGYVIY